MVLHGRTLQSTPESGARATYDGYKRRKGSKLHMVVDTLGHLLTLTVRPAGQQERAQVETLVTAVQAVTSDQVAVAFADPGYTVAGPAMAAAEQGITLEIVPLPETKRGFALLPRRWVVERSFAWLSRFQRLARDFERLPEMLAGLHCLAFACLMLAKAVKLFASS